jgi:hypothetical protein
VLVLKAQNNGGGSISKTNQADFNDLKKMMGLNTTGHSKPPLVVTTSRSKQNKNLAQELGDV